MPVADAKWLDYVRCATKVLRDRATGMAGWSISGAIQDVTETQASEEALARDPGRRLEHVARCRETRYINGRQSRTR